jgi:hypothetical protein
MSKSEEVRAAAERLARFYGGETYYTVWGCEPTMHGHQQRDERKVLDACLPWFDETPIDEAWLGSVGFEWDDELEEYVALGNESLPLTFDNVLQRWMFGGAKVSAPRTRGDVRRLCSALSIQLKDRPQ